MKAFALIIILAGAAALAGCESDLPPEPGRENPLQRGFRGEGQLTRPESSGDPFIEEDHSASRY
jgi:hypothetical protein